MADVSQQTFLSWPIGTFNYFGDTSGKYKQHLTNLVEFESWWISNLRFITPFDRSAYTYIQRFSLKDVFNTYNDIVHTRDGHGEIFALDKC